MNLQHTFHAKNAAQSDNPLISGILQRKCACGNHITAREKCGACQNGNLTAHPAPVQRQNDEAAENRTGMPGPLKAGLEALSGKNLSGIRVHTNSSRPAQLDALAYTQGRDIHMAPGQEKHLGHEGWHVVQQMQGRVKPTIQARGVSINDDVGLEREADVMGSIALQAKGEAHPKSDVAGQNAGTFPWGSAIQRQQEPVGQGEASVSDAAPVNTALASELKRKRGGLGVKVPLTTELLDWVEAKQEPDHASASPDAKNKSAPENFSTGTIEGTPFVWGSADERAVHINDVEQGYLGDCYLMAILAAIARTRPELIEKMIIPNPDGTYDIRFPDGHVEASVTTVFVTYESGSPVYARTGDTALRGKELWPLLIEKAWALRHTSKARRKAKKPDYLEIEGGRIKSPTIGLTGKKAKRFELPGGLSSKKLFAKLEDHFVEQKLPVVFYSLNKKFKKKLKGSGDDALARSGKGPVKGNHAYTVRKVDTSARTLDLYNPWGSAHQVGRDMSFMRQFFRSVLFLGLAPSTSNKKLSVLAPTEEEKVGKEGVPKEILEGSGLNAVVVEFKKNLGGTSSRTEAREIVAKHAWLLWKRAKTTVQTGMESGKKGVSDIDDRPLYWARLTMASLIRGYRPLGYQLLQAERLDLIDLLENISRGLKGIVFPKSMAKGERRILISGFDPFGFQWRDPDQPDGKWNRRQGNPSGAAVLALDGKTIQEGEVKGRVEGVIFPVRFADFDQGIVESTFTPYLRGKNSVDMIMTISQGTLEHHRKGRDQKHPQRRKRLEDAFELEKWAGKRRSSSASDNLGTTQSGKPQRGMKPLVGPEFLESSLPRAEIIKALRRRGKVPGRETEDETEFEFRPKQRDGFGPAESGGKPRSLPKQPNEPPPGARSVAGSGGGFLSNEIFYRTALLRLGNKEKGIEESKVPVGHLHVPFLPPPTSKEGSQKAHATLLKKIINMVIRILKLALPNIGA